MPTPTEDPALEDPALGVGKGSPWSQRIGRAELMDPHVSQEAKNDRFLVLDTTDTTGYLRRAENRVGALGAGSSPVCPWLVQQIGLGWW